MAIPFTIKNRSGRGDTVYMYFFGKVGADSGWIEPDGTFHAWPTGIGPIPIEAPDASFVGPADGDDMEITLPLLISGRLYFSYGQKMNFRVVEDGALVQPAIQNPSDPNTNILFNFSEFTLDPGGLWINSTQVDFFSAPYQVGVEKTDGSFLSTGMLKPDGLQNVIDALAETEGWEDLAQYDGDDFLRVLCPVHAIETGDLAADVLDPYVDLVWGRYATEDLIVTPYSYDLSKIFTGRVVGDDMVFKDTSNVTVATFPKPDSDSIFGCYKDLEAPNNDIGAIARTIAAAYNRSTLYENNDQPDPDGSNFYQHAVTNYYCKFIHQEMVNGKAYGFAFDDVGQHESLVHDPTPVQAFLQLDPFEGAATPLFEAEEAPEILPTGIPSPAAFGTPVVARQGDPEPEPVVPDPFDPDPGGGIPELPYLTSTNNRIPAEPPILLAGEYNPILDLPTGAAPVFDWLIDGVPFLSWPSEEDPYLRDTKEDVKDQFDSSREAGEQSFGYWWLRSQASYHGGAGQQYLDSDQTEVSRLRYSTSTRVDPWTAGQASVRPTMQRTAAGAGHAELVTWASVRTLVWHSTTTNTVTAAPISNLAAQTVITLGASGAVQAIASDGQNIFAACNDTIWRVTESGTVTNVGAISFDGPVTLGWAKQRVIACAGPRVYEVDPSGVGAPTLIYTHPSPQWRYTAVADGPNGIYLAGYLGPLSELSMMAVTDSGETVTLGAPIVQLRTPPSELIHDVVFYLNAFFGLATSNGIRVGSFTAYGQPQYGPLLNPGNPAYAATGSGSLLYFGGANSLWSVDIGTPIGDGRFAHARLDAQVNPGSDTDAFTSLSAAVVNGVDALFGVQESEAITWPGNTRESGTLTTSWARFGTVEPKRMHYIRVEGSFPTRPDGPALRLTVESIDSGTKVFDIPGGARSYEFGLSTVQSAEAFRVTFQLFGDTVLRSWQLKGRPTPPLYQELILPLGCWDREMAADGQETGYDGYAMERLLRLEDSAKTSRVVTVADRHANIQYQAQISRCQYRQTVLPGRTQRNGGKVTLVLRLV